MAKQFGVSDEAIAGLNDPSRFPFPPDQKAALLLADAMTEGDGHVPDALFDELRLHFDEPQIVEIATVIGLFNYFNRFNNAFKMDVTLTDPDVVVERVRQAALTENDPRTICERACEILAQGRRYFGVGIYRREKERMAEIAWRGPAQRREPLRPEESHVAAVGRTGLARVIDDLPEGAADVSGRTGARSELVVPVRIGPAILGVIDAQSDRQAAFDDEDRALLERVAEILAPALAGSMPADR